MTVNIHGTDVMRILHAQRNFENELRANNIPVRNISYSVKHCRLTVTIRGVSHFKMFQDTESVLQYLSDYGNVNEWRGL